MQRRLRSPFFSSEGIYGSALLFFYVLLRWLGVLVFFWGVVMSLRFYSCFALLVLLSVFSLELLAGSRKSGGSIQTPSGACYASHAEACASVVVVSGTSNITARQYDGYQCQVKDSKYTWPNNWISIGYPSSCDASCPAGHERFNGMCVPVCESGFTRDEAGVCQPPDEPCDANDQAAAQSAVAAQNALPATVSNGNLASGYNQVNESVTTFGSCESTCKISVSISVSIGEITPPTYQIVDKTTWSYVGGECTNLAPSNTTSTSKNIGYGGEGTGCASGFSYGSVNGQIGCHYHGETSSGGSGTPTTSSTSGTSTSTTTDNGDGTTTTTTTSSSTTTSTQGLPGGGTNGSGIGCDPTSADYFECVAPQGDELQHTAGNADDFGEAVQNFVAGVSATPVGQVATGLANVFPSGGGICPAPGFDIFGQHFQIDMHCTLYSNVAGMLSAVMLIFWSIVGVRVIVSA